MLDKNRIGHEFPAFTTTVERSRLRFFAKAIGETDAEYTDVAAARESGYADLPAPPTYPFVLDMDSPELFPYVKLLGIDMNRVLHGAQEFEYFAPIQAGDAITVSSRIKDIYDKKGGALEFIIIENRYSNQHGDRVAAATTTVVYRNA